MSKRILTIEEDGKLANALQKGLKNKYIVVQMGDVNKALEDVQSKKWELVILDGTWAEGNIYDHVQALREFDVIVPVIVILKSRQITFTMNVFHYGANDFIIKPYSNAELILRTLRQLESNQNQYVQSGIYQVDAMCINKKLRTVNREGRQIELTPKEFDLLLYLVQHKGQVMSRKQLTSAVWGYEYLENSNIVDVYIQYLRKKVDKGFKKNLIHTRRGVGYFIKSE